ncbi:hypothetical protein HIM_09317 [Hirsutella minnesotensis 3608]|uniref:Xylanolytic transcriptional activator regulatory domain-containing protein n=1 Tax=Hirsutella minnesotensis 3608 TaxID=1043627 RepID=A0A0F7ZXU0_9HYPO|nr:hypothetical protein HIM_09317 [Hirsutella minnesotensis 3608]
MERQDERRANLVLVSRVRELEARLAALSPGGSDASRVSTQDGAAPSLGSQSDAASRETSRAAESSADAIATGLFDQPPAVDIGYFGSSSNHAFFWSLSSSIERMSCRTNRRQCEPLTRHGPTAEDQARHPESLPGRTASHLDDGEFPGSDAANGWTRRFFATVGAVFPYVDESLVLHDVECIQAQRKGWLPVKPSTQALLSIIFAYALHTMQDGSPEPYYRQTLRLLDDKAISLPTTETLQALLLLASFQQNTQRSMESWAPHYVAVRVAYQLGVHAPASYDSLGPWETQLRSRLWCAVVNQDRRVYYRSIACLARPCLIPPQHVRMEISDLMRPLQSSAALHTDQKLLFFHHLYSIHEILGEIVDLIYSSNINTSYRPSLTDLVTKTICLSTKLEYVITANADFSTWMPADFDAERYTVLLSIFYCRAMMLLHGSLLMTVLEQVTGSDAFVGVLVDTALSMLRSYLRALSEWLRLIDGLLGHQPSFLKCNAAWWTSNYMMLSTCIHIFAFWLLSKNLDSSPILGMPSNDIEALLKRGLETLKRLGGSSIMSRKAHRCLHRYLQFLNAHHEDGGFETEHSLRRPVGSIAPGGSGVLADIRVGNDAGADSLSSCIDDVFGRLSQDDLMSSGFLGFDQPISDFDAVGFI